VGTQDRITWPLLTSCDLECSFQRLQTSRRPKPGRQLHISRQLSNYIRTIGNNVCPAISSYCWSIETK